MESLVEMRVVVPEARFVSPDLRGEPISEAVEGLGPVVGATPGGQRGGGDGEHGPRLPAAFRMLDRQAQVAELRAERRKQPLEARLFLRPVRTNVLPDPQRAFQEDQVVLHGSSFQGVAGPPVPLESWATRLRRTIRTLAGRSTCPEIAQPRLTSSMMAPSTPSSRSSEPTASWKAGSNAFPWVSIGATSCFARTRMNSRSMSRRFSMSVGSSKRAQVKMSMAGMKSRKKSSSACLVQVCFSRRTRSW